MKRTITVVGTPHCIPCKQMKAILAPFKQVLTEVNAEDDPQLAQALGVTSVPCTIIYEGAKEVTRFVGLTSPVSIEKALEED
jgi:thioredoxin-like negative regulator of GroEL